MIHEINNCLFPVEGNFILYCIYYLAFNFQILALMTSREESPSNSRKKSNVYSFSASSSSVPRNNKIEVYHGVKLPKDKDGNKIRVTKAQADSGTF